MKIIKDCYIGPEIYGVYSVTLPLRRFIVYAQDIRELVGFRTAQDILITDKTTFIEVGTFFNLIYENDFTAWKVFTCNPSYVDVDNLSYLYESYEEFVNVGLIETFTNIGKENLKKISQKLVDFGEFSYLCGEQIMIAESLILSKKFEPSNTSVLQSILDYRLSDETVKERLAESVENIERHLEGCGFADSIDRTNFNELLLKLRGL